MVKKSLIIVLTVIILSLCCGFSFAADNNSGNSINLGNEITQSVDKTGQSMRNLTDSVFSGNMINDVRSGMDNMRTDVENGMNNIDNGIVDTTDNNNNDNGFVGTTDNNNGNAGNYNTTRTTAEGTATTGFNTMSTTTWLWIILAVAAIIVIAAIWYYATQNND